MQQHRQGKRSTQAWRHGHDPDCSAGFLSRGLQRLAWTHGRTLRRCWLIHHLIQMIDAPLLSGMLYMGLESFCCIDYLLRGSAGPLFKREPRSRASHEKVQSLSQNGRGGPMQYDHRTASTAPGTSPCICSTSDPKVGNCPNPLKSAIALVSSGVQVMEADPACIACGRTSAHGTLTLLTAECRRLAV